MFFELLTTNNSSYQILMVPEPSLYPQETKSRSAIFPLEYKEAFLTKGPKPIKVVIDTNVYISAIIFDGIPEDVLNLIKDKKVVGFTSPKILLALSDKLNSKFGWNEEKVELVIKNLSRYIQVVDPGLKLTVVKEDPEDNKILECAVATNSDYIVTGDKHLHKLIRFEEIKIVAPGDFIKIIGKQK